MNETCGCCEGIRRLTPVPTANHPGLDRLSYRVGTHTTFLTTMLARLSSPDYPELASLAVRTDDDPTVALLDAWATIGDVLTFYQERIANEGYLRTATERRSVLELARLVGYTLRPGVAATVYLAYTLDRDPQKDDTVVVIPVGSRVQSVPGPGEMPQTFETSEDLEARYSWSKLRPRLTRPTRITSGTLDALATLYFSGMTTNLKANDRLVPVFMSAQGQGVVGAPPLKVKTVSADPLVDRTRVTLQAPPQQAVMSQITPSAAAAMARRDDDQGAAAVLGLSALLGPLKRPPSLQPRSTRALERSVQELFRPASDVNPQVLTHLSPRLTRTLYPAWAEAELTAPSQLESLQALRVRAAPFGATAPLKPVVDARGIVVGREEWPLGQAQSFSVQVHYRDNAPTGGEAAVTRGSESASTAIDVTTSGTRIVNLGTTPVVSVTTDVINPPPIQINLRATTQPAQTDQRIITVTFALPDNSVLGRITVTQTDDQPSLDVAVSNDPGITWHPEIGQRLVVASGDHRTTVELTAAATGGGGGAGTVSTAAAAVPQVALGNLTVTQDTLSPEHPAVLALDAQYDQILPGSWVVVERTGEQQPLVTQVTKVETVAKSAYNVTAKVTQLTLATSWLRSEDRLLSAVRGVTVHAQSEPLDLAWEPVPDEVSRDAIVLDQLHGQLQSGRWVIVSGERTDLGSTAGVRGSELVMLASVTQEVDATLPGDRVRTVLHLAKALAYRYRRDSVTIWGNVVKATHGESRQEVLGSGDGGQPLQSFTLRQPPLTYLPASNPIGARSTLEVRVHDVLWHETDTLVDLGPTDHGYITRTDNDDRTAVVFGNGVHGTRLPTGVENVKARYRNGVGAGGNVHGEQITMLQNRPLGVSGVVNPLPATGGADHDSLERARGNTPLAIMALDRLLSVVDYENFSRARAGIGKASARRLSDGRRDLVHLTIAGVNDIPIDPSSDLYQTLQDALSRSGDPHQPVEVATRELGLLIISARVRVDADHLWEFVEPQVRGALLARYSFERRRLGQDVLLSEVVSAVQAVPGVVYVDVDVMHAVPETVTPAQLQTLATILVPPPPPRIQMHLASVRPLTHTVQTGEKLEIIANLYGLGFQGVDKLVEWNPGITGETTLVAGQLVIIDPPRLRPAQLALLSPTLPDTLILKEIKG